MIYKFENQEDATEALNAMNGKRLVEEQPAINGMFGIFTLIGDFIIIVYPFFRHPLASDE